MNSKENSVEIIVASNNNYEGHDDHIRIPFLRYLILFVSTLCAALGISCHFAYNFAVVCKVNSTVDTLALYEMDPSNSPVMHFPTSLTNIIYATFPAGNLLCLMMLILLKGKVSMRAQIIFGCAISSISTALIPIAYDSWPASTLILKTIQGAAAAPCYPLIGHVSSHWAPITEFGVFVAILSGYSQIGMFLTMASAGPLCIVLLLIAFLFYDMPAQHHRIKLTELTLIKPQKVEAKKAAVPYRKLFSNASVWAILIAAVGDYCGITPLLVFSAAIMKKAIGLSDLQTSAYNSVSFAAQLLMKVAGGVISDRWKSVSETFKVRFFNTSSCGVAGVLIIVLAFLPVNSKMTCSICMTLAQACIGFNSAGFNKAAMIVTKQFAYFVMTMIGIIISITSIFDPFLVWAVAPDTTWNQWFYLLLYQGSVLILTNLCFCILVKAEPASFTFEEPKCDK